jgi:copper chaperone CopZ
VRSALTKVPGVISADVSMPDKAVVKYRKDKTTPEKMIAAIKKAGYSAEVRKDKSGEKTPERDAKKSS